MGGLAHQRALERRIEAALRQERWIVAGSILVVAALAWAYLWRDAAMMAAMPGQMTASAAFSMTVAMWIIMMIGMMLPSATPAILLYGGMVRAHRARGNALPATWIFAGGYLAVWSLFSLAAALLQLALERSMLLSPMLVSASAGLSAALLIAAGIYQWTPLKQACLHQCRAPLPFFMTRWRAGVGGAFRMGLEHGAYCLGCCWALMLLLFVAGVMNLLWVAAIAGFVLAEKLLPRVRWTSHIAGGALVAAGIASLALA